MLQYKRLKQEREMYSMSSSAVERTVSGELRVTLSLDHVDMIFGYSTEREKLYIVCRTRGYISKNDNKRAWGRARQEFENFLKKEKQLRLCP